MKRRLEVRELKWCTLKFAVAFFFLSIRALPLEANPMDCSTYRNGELRENQIAVYKPRDEANDVPPPRLQTIFYREEYVVQPHIKDTNDPPYEVLISFDLNIDTGQPVPQFSFNYVQNARNNRDFRVSVSGWEGSLTPRLSAPLGLPLNGSIPVESYEVVGHSYGMSEVSYATSTSEHDLGARFSNVHDRNDIFVVGNSKNVSTLMLCGKEQSFPRPHCRVFTTSYPFLLVVRFKRSLLDELDQIRTHSMNFSECLLK